MSRSPVPGALLGASGALLGGVGLALLLAPGELGAALGLLPGWAGAVGRSASPPPTLGLELFGGALVAFGFLDWMGRGALYGGIYGRPIAMANMLLGVAAGATLLRDGEGVWAGILGALFVCLAAAFAWILFSARPWAGTTGPPEDAPGGPEG